MTEKTNITAYNLYLNNQARILLFEYETALKNKLWATTIVLSLTIIDNIFSDQTNLDFFDGVDLNAVKNLKDIHWLRMRRNQILHYEGPSEGFWGSYKSEKILKSDALQAQKIINKVFKELFPKNP